MKFYPSLFCLALMFCSLCAKAQITISGKVCNAQKKILTEVKITLKDTYDGGTTNSKGLYSFPTEETGAQILVFAIRGYDTLEIPVNIGSSDIHIDTVLKRDPNALADVTVVSKTMIAGDKQAAMTVSMMDIYTSASANGDLSSGLKLLPGVQQSNEREGLAVRGGDVYETKQFIEGTLVNNPYYTNPSNISARTRYNPSLFKDIAFSTGGYSALYGQALSSALLLETVDIPDKSEKGLFLLPMYWGASFQQVTKSKKLSYGATYGYTNIGLYFKLVKQTPDFYRKPQYHDADANFRFKTWNDGVVKYYGMFGYSDMALRRNSIDSIIYKNQNSIRNNNHYHNLAWRQPFRNQWTLRIGLSYSRNQDKIGQQLVDEENVPVADAPSHLDTLSFDLRKTDQLAQSKIVLEKRWQKNIALRFGGEYWMIRNDIRYNDWHGNTNDDYKAAFAESEFYITENLAVKPGVRWEHSNIIDATNIAPRANLAYHIGTGQNIIASYGIFYQKPENNYLYYNRDFQMSRADHYILNYTYNHKGLMVRAEGYYKNYSRLIRFQPEYDNSGSGDAKGFDLFIRDKNKTFKDFEYWISYSYVDTKRDYLNFPEAMQPYFVASNTLNIVTKKYLSKINSGFSFSYNFSSPRPYYNIMKNSDNQFYISDRGWTNQFQTLNFSAYYLTNIFKGFGIIIASVSNILGRNNVSGYQYSINGIHKQAILPPAKRFYNLGVMISWGVDRTQDNINNNL